MQSSDFTTLKMNEDAILNIIEHNGLVLKTGRNLNTFRDLVEAQPERHAVAMFHATCSDECVEDVFWLTGFNNQGELVHTQAIKLFDISKMLLKVFLHHQVWNIFPPGYSPDYTERAFYLSDEAQKMQGRVVYHGEIWLKDPYRGGELSLLLSRLMLIWCVTLWRPDYILGFQLPLTALKGLGARASYMRMEQRSLVMSNPRTNAYFEAWLVWMSLSEAVFNLKLPAKSIEALFKPDELK